MEANASVCKISADIFNPIPDSSFTNLIWSVTECQSYAAKGNLISINCSTPNKKNNFWAVHDELEILV